MILLTISVVLSLSDFRSRPKVPAVCCTAVSAIKIGALAPARTTSPVHLRACWPAASGIVARSTAKPTGKVIIFLLSSQAPPKILLMLSRVLLMMLETGSFSVSSFSAASLCVALNPVALSSLFKTAARSAALLNGLKPSNFSDKDILVY